MHGLIPEGVQPYIHILQIGSTHIHLIHSAGPLVDLPRRVWKGTIPAPEAGGSTQCGHAAGVQAQRQQWHGGPCQCCHLLGYPAWGSFQDGQQQLVVVAQFIWFMLPACWRLLGTPKSMLHGAHSWACYTFLEGPTRNWWMGYCSWWIEELAGWWVDV